MLTKKLEVTEEQIAVLAESVVTLAEFADPSYDTGDLEIALNSVFSKNAYDSAGFYKFLKKVEVYRNEQTKGV